jgi:hypothetical protein
MVRLASDGIYEKVVRLIRAVTESTVIDDGTDALSTQFAKKKMEALKSWTEDIQSLPASSSTKEKKAKKNKKKKKGDDSSSDESMEKSPEPSSRQQSPTPSPVEVGKTAAKPVAKVVKSTKQAAGGTPASKEGGRLNTKKGASSSSNAGRKKAALDEYLAKSLAELKDADDSSPKFFGSEWKNLKRNWDNYLTYVGDLIKVEADEEKLTELEKLEKSAKIAQRVLTKAQSAGMSDSQIVRLYEEQVVLMTKDPAVDNPFPQWFKKLMYLESIANATNSDFFVKLDVIAMAEFCEKDAIIQQCEACFAERLELVTKPDGARKCEDTKSSLKQLLSASAACKVSEVLTVPLEHTKVLVLAPGYPTDASSDERFAKFVAAKAYMYRRDCKVGISFLKHEHGRLIMDFATKKFATVQGMEKKQKEYVTALTPLLNDSGTLDNKVLVSLQSDIGDAGAAEVVSVASLLKARALKSTRLCKMIVSRKLQKDWSAKEVTSLIADLQNAAETKYLHAIHPETEHIETHYDFMMDFLIGLKELHEKGAANVKNASQLYVGLKLFPKSEFRSILQIDCPELAKNLDVFLEKVLESAIGKTLLDRMLKIVAPTSKEVNDIMQTHFPEGAMLRIRIFEPQHTDLKQEDKH